MSQTKNKSENVKNDSTANKKKKTKPRMATHSKFLWFALVIALVPFLYLGYLLIDASLQTGEPIHGDRYLNDLDPAITESQLSQIELSVKGTTGVDAVELFMDSATLRLMVDVRDDMSAEDTKKLGSSLVSSIFEIIPVNPYFTMTGMKKMYDLEVYLTNVKATAGNVPSVIVLAHKTSGMEAVAVDILSAPKNQEYVDALRAKEAKAEEDAKNPPVTSASGDATTAPVE